MSTSAPNSEMVIFDAHRSERFCYACAQALWPKLDSWLTKADAKGNMFPGARYGVSWLKALPSTGDRICRACQRKV